MSADPKSYPSQLEKVKAITDQLEAGIQSLFESEKFKQYLKTLSKFHNYSLNNTLLIAMQRPDATLVAGYTTWKRQFGRQVRKGANGIRILAPAPYKKKIEVDKTDTATGRIVKIRTEPMRRKRRRFLCLRSRWSMFSMSARQTESRCRQSVSMN